jgi:hypothetical protein
MTSNGFWRGRPAMLLAGVLVLGAGTSAKAQQRPLTTEDPEPIGAGRLLLEAGVDWVSDREYPASGLVGDLLRVPLVGISIGLGSMAELQIDGGLYNRLAITSASDAPLAEMVDLDGNTTSDVEDIVVGTKVRFLTETPGRPGMAVRFATRLPNAGNESGLGLDTTDFLATLLVGKTVGSFRIVGNAGLGILGDPTRGDAQNDVLVYGVSVARAFTDRAEFVSEIEGRAHTAGGEAPPGTGSRAMLRFGGRYTYGSGRFDAALLVGLTALDGDWGLGAGYTHVFGVSSTP